MDPWMAWLRSKRPSGSAPQTDRVSKTIREASSTTNILRDEEVPSLVRDEHLTVVPEVEDGVLP